MSTTVNDRWGRLPENVLIKEDLSTGDVHLAVRGRDEWLTITITRDTPWLRDRKELHEVIARQMQRLRAREAKLDAVTAKLMS